MDSEERRRVYVMPTCGCGDVDVLDHDCLIMCGTFAEDELQAWYNLFLWSNRTLTDSLPSIRCRGVQVSIAMAGPRAEFYVSFPAGVTMDPLGERVAGFTRKTCDPDELNAMLAMVPGVRPLPTLTAAFVPVKAVAARAPRTRRT